jgi:hypothetical protein
MTNTDLEVIGVARRHVGTDLEIRHYVSCYAADRGARQRPTPWEPPPSPSDEEGALDRQSLP